MTSTTKKQNKKASAAAFMQMLRRDHAGLSRILRAVDSLVDRLGTEPEAVQPVLIEAFGYLLDYQHGYHHPREDRLFGRIQGKRPALADTLAKLAKEHETGEHETGQLTDDLAKATTDELRGKKGERLSARIHDYVGHARAHMRDEEAVFYARAESVLDASDWLQIVDGDDVQDPLADLEMLADDYPELAAYFDLPTRNLGFSEDENNSSALHRHVLSLTDVYGGLMHDGLNLARLNTRRMLSVRSPVGLIRAVGAITSDNLNFVGQCVVRPSRWAINTGAEMMNPKSRSDL